MKSTNVMTVLLIVALFLVSSALSSKNTLNKNLKKIKTDEKCVLVKCLPARGCICNPPNCGCRNRK